MKIIHLNKFYDKKIEDLSIAIGVFDGIHLAHRQLLDEALAKKNKYGLKSAVLTFEPDPLVILKPGDHYHLTSIKDKIKIFRELGFDYLLVVDFTLEFSQLSKSEFIDFLIKLGCVELTCGFDYRFGIAGEGTAADLLKVKAFNTSVIKQVGEPDKISSTKIASLITNGDISTANDQLGRVYSIKGKVIHGHKVGRRIGFPTANISLEFPYVLPANGVYQGMIQVNKLNYQCVINVGYNPTFNRNVRSIEVLIKDFNKYIYNYQVRVFFVSFIRNEIKFASVDELAKQIKQDFMVLSK